jgi:ankyrin repeat protein
LIQREKIMSLELLEKYIKTGDAAALSDLLESNPGLVKVKTTQLISPLMLSCYYKNPELSDIILKYVPEPDIHEAAACGMFKSLAKIVYSDPELINTFSEDGFTPLGLASFFEHEDTARYLLLKGAEVNVHSKNDLHVYPIHSAVAANNADITKILLEAGAEVNVVQQLGYTPLHSAAFHGNVEIIILLLEAGADIKAKTDEGKTPADVAEEKGFKEIAGVLRP